MLGMSRLRNQASIYCSTQSQIAQSSETQRHAIHQLRVLHWNYESLATKFPVLSDALEHY